MIRSEDFDITITTTENGVDITVNHKPTGNVRSVEAIPQGSVGKVRDSLIAELRSLLFRESDIRCDTGRSSGGDFIRVVHLPSGIERSAMRRESTHEELLDAVLEELQSPKGNCDNNL